jgi:hypothetical protein
MTPDRERPALSEFLDSLWEVTTEYAHVPADRLDFC